MHRALLAVLLSPVLLWQPAVAQDANFLYPIPRIDQLLHADGFKIIDVAGSRAPGDRTQRVVLQYPDSTVMIVKWASAPKGGHAFNNAPRYEAAAYELQKLFLPPEEYVVPPTALRAFPLALAQTADAGARPTFDDASSVVTLVQYWMSSVTTDDFWDKDRFEVDTMYARYLGNMNLFTHLIDHRDANTGNFLISTSPSPRLFAVDNGVAFRSERSNRGTEWGRLRVDRLPRATIERLRALTEDEVHAALETLVEFTVQNGELTQVAPGPNLDEKKGVREKDGRIQLGLTNAEIGDITKRIRELLKRVDDGKIQTF